MIRFFHILFLNAWRGMRRANAIPAITLVFIAVCLLFIGSNASASTSGQDTAHKPRLAVVIHPETVAFGGGKDAGLPANMKTVKSKPSQDKDSGGPVVAVISPDQAPSTTSVTNSQPALGATATPSLIPDPVVAACVQGQMTYNVQTALLTFAQPTTTSGNITWFWESRIDSGSNPSSPPVNAAQHTQAVPAGSTSASISSSDPSQPLLSTTANSSYAYSFRLDITSPFTANSDWVSVPEATTCPQS